MKLFLRKINDNVEYIQLCPNGSRRSKDAIRNRHIEDIKSCHSGLTGDSLIEFVLEFIEKTRFREEEYDAILIEDDKDNRFLRLEADGSSEIDNEGWATFRSKTTEAIHAKYQGIPVLFLYAAPEVETWFLADWENSFGTVFRNILTSEQNKLFSVRFHRHVNSEILTRKYEDSLEQYGYFEGVYRKLSEEIQQALLRIDFLDDGKPDEHQLPRYSKRVQGETMLEEIDPDVVMQRCSVFFKSGMLALQTL